MGRIRMATPLPYPPHRVALLQTKWPGHLLIHEIYRSLQGESTFAGLPCVFVRTTVCGSGAPAATPHTPSPRGRMRSPRSYGGWKSWTARSSS